jgi:opacity protein-like surface antigen
MIRLASATITLIFLIGSFALAQGSTPKVQVFGGFSLVHTSPGGLTGVDMDSALRQPVNTFGIASNFNGWNAEAQYNISRWLGIAADFGGHNGKPVIAASGSTVSGLPNGSAYSFLAGPVLSYRTKSRMTPFVHALFGWERASLNASNLSGVSSPATSAATAYTDVAAALGGGLDFRVSRHFALRLAQVDDFYTTHNLNKFYGSAFGIGSFQGLATHEDNLRVSTGIELRF